MKRYGSPGGIPWRRAAGCLATACLGLVPAHASEAPHLRVDSTSFREGAVIARVTIVNDRKAPLCIPYYYSVADGRGALFGDYIRAYGLWGSAFKIAPGGFIVEQPPVRFLRVEAGGSASATISSRAYRNVWPGFIRSIRAKLYGFPCHLAGEMSPLEIGSEEEHPAEIRALKSIVILDSGSVRK